MIIAITQSGGLELKEPDDFKGFKIAVEKSGMTDAEIGAALAGVATMDPEGKHAWVYPAALKNWGGKPQAAEWSASFDAMCEKVKKYGYIDAATGNVRAHLERA
jgi:hypothetical protein